MKLGFFQSIGITIGSTAIITGNSVLAQITPDATLPNNSQVRLQDNIRFIEGGTQAGGNLFHSFKEFSVPTNSTAYFNNNDTGVQNILTRVTGGSVSNIDGLIRAGGNANLFLINPNGIIFGQNARLDIKGSFVGSTANAIGFGNLGNFSATNPEAPSPLLTINPNALLFNQIQGGRIENNSAAPAGRNPSDAFNVTDLRVADGKSLLLVGGDVNLNGGRLYAFGGRVELGGLAGIGTVGLNENGGNFSLSFPLGVQRSDVFLFNNADVNVRAGNGGSVAINARNLQMTDGSQILAGIENRLSSENSKAGNIDINATGIINLQQRSDIFNDVQANALGQGGDVNIRTGTLRLADGSEIGARTYSAGQGGNLTVNAISEVEVTGRSADGRIGSALFTKQDSEGATGNAGNLTINTPWLRVLDGGLVIAITNGAGRGGNLNIDTSNGRVEAIGTNRIAAEANHTALGSGGNLTIKTGELISRDGASVSASTFGAGQGGNLIIDATSKVEVAGSGLYVLQGTKDATGNPGNLIINTRLLQVLDGATVTGSTSGAGQGGNLKIDAGRVEVIGTSSSGNGSSITSEINSGALGLAGNLTINTSLLRVLGGATVSTSTRGAGRGGDLNIDTGNGRVEVIGTSSDGFGSNITAESNSTATGAAGNLTIKTGELIARDGGFISASTLGAGQGGNLRIDATSSVELIGENTVDSQFPSGLFAQQDSEGSAGKGNAGNLTINTPLLQVLGGATISAGTFGAGQGGELNIDTGNGRVEVIGTSSDGFGSNITAESNSTATGAAGNLTIKTGELIARDGGFISASTLGAGQGGNLRIDATSSVELIGENTVDSQFPSGLFAQQDSEGSAGKGNAGNLTINTPLLQVLGGATISAGTFGAGQGGELNIDTGNGRVEVIGTSSGGSGSSITTQSNPTATGAAGNLTIKMGELIARDGGQVDASTDGAGQGGNLRIEATSKIELIGVNTVDGTPSGLFAQQSTSGEAGKGNAGNLTINTPLLRVLDGANVSASTFGAGRGGESKITADQILVRNAVIGVQSFGTGTAGNLTINAKNSINLDSDAKITANTLSNGVDQAIININSADLILRRGSEITTNASGFDVTGGNINISTNNLALLENSRITANSTDARGGKIDINTQGLFQSLDSRITARGATQELSGTVNINTLVDPSRGAAELPEYLVNAAALINQNFCARAYNSSFIITGRGGIAPSPYDVFTGETTWEDWRINPIAQGRGEGEKVTSVMDEKKVTTTAPKEIVEAQGWVVNKKGQVELVASTENVTPYRLQSVPVECLLNTAN
ncbi:MAG: filamentous hemagglutinin N-terminal domain-containing protein [Scytonematopsis contorta HA4267-MV1]|jgi:filamentous hemagglutinin family protein|nr:filamentous hemagglutinin N-terminal domain-containing protein [Scytonematopsis contorta HA4267-MV1]